MDAMALSVLLARPTLRQLRREDRAEAAAVPPDTRPIRLRIGPPRTDEERQAIFDAMMARIAALPPEVRAAHEKRHAEARASLAQAAAKEAQYAGMKKRGER
jgi:hypothetical protein